MIRYWNFYLSREQNAYYRVRYTVMMVIGEVGGVMSVAGSILFYILKPFYYKRNELQVMLELEKKRTQRQEQNLTQLKVKIPSFISLRFMIFDAANYFRKRGIFPQLKDPNNDPMYILKQKISDAMKNFFSLEQILKIGLLE